VELLHICVRTLPWHDEAAVAASLDPIVRGRVELWRAEPSAAAVAELLREMRLK
jgi:hypothetical protein